MNEVLIAALIILCIILFLLVTVIFIGFCVFKKAINENWW